MTLEKSISKPTDLIAIFKILSDENRLRIYNILKKQKMCVCEIEALLHLNQANVSRHLSKMLQVGLVKHEKDGQWIRYEVSPGFLENEDKLVAYMDEKIDQTPIISEDNEVLDRYKNSKLCCTDIKTSPDKVELVLYNNGGKL